MFCKTFYRYISAFLYLLGEAERVRRSLTSGGCHGVLESKLIGAFFTGRYVPVFSSAERTRRRFLKSKSSGSVPFCFIYCPNCLSLNGVIWNELHNVGDCSSVLFAYSIPRLQNNNTTINGVS
jgi:hypothetical protein